MPGKTLKDRLSSIFPMFEGDTNFKPWLEAHEDEVERLDGQIEEVKKSLQVDHATKQELDLIGRDFGILGKRRGRDDPAYRSYLKSLVQSFKGRGTPPGVRQAVAAGVATEASNITLYEDFQNNKYEVELEAWNAHKSGTVRNLADLSDPLSIGRRDPVYYYLGEGKISLSLASGHRETTANASSTSITITGTQGHRTLNTNGLSSSTLEPLSADGGWTLI